MLLFTLILDEYENNFSSRRETEFYESSADSEGDNRKT